MTVLTGREIVELGIVSGFPRLSTGHVQPAGVDVSIADVVEYPISSGSLGPDLKKLPDTGKRQDSGFFLKPGQAYIFRLNEKFSIPNDCVGLMYPRSSMLRIGADVRTAVWDPGYRGKGQVLVVVHNPSGITLEPNTRIAQVVFHTLEEDTDGYDGSYQGEGL